MQLNDIQGVILAGGLARRLNGAEKGLQLLQGKPLISHILERLSPQICNIWLNVNRSQKLYQQQYPNILRYSDNLAGFQGALSGMLSGFKHIDSEYLLFVPCDTPYLPKNLVTKLSTALRINHVKIAYAHDGEQPHPTIALIHRSIMPMLQDYLNAGERRIFHFFQSQPSIAVDFSEQKQAFKNFNTPEDFIDNLDDKTTDAIPLLAITGYSGTGKTTLLEKLIPQLNQQNIKVGLIKHSHHNIDIDKQGKDSYRLRMAGANPTVIVCDERWAMMVETPSAKMTFEDLVKQLQTQNIDLILVEGFKQDALPKIQLHRKVIHKPLPELDKFTLATATDYPISRENLLDINNIEQIATFIIDTLSLRKPTNSID